MLTSQQILEARQTLGLSKTGVVSTENSGASLIERLKKTQQTQPVLNISTKPTVGEKIKEAAQDVGQVFEGVYRTSEKRGQNIADLEALKDSGQRGWLETKLKQRGQQFGSGADAIGEVFKGIIKLASSQEREDLLKSKVGELGSSLGPVVGKTKLAQNLVGWYDGLDDRAREAVDAAGGVIQLASEFIGVGLVGEGTEQFTKRVLPIVSDAATQSVRAANKVADGVVSGVDSVASSVAQALPSNETLSGLSQTASELANRVPRAVDRAGEALQESANRANRIANSTPEVGSAIESGLKENIITFASQADDATKADALKMLNLAENTSTGMKQSARPSIVAGDAAVSQYDLILKQKRTIGEQLGEQAKLLSKNTVVDMTQEVGSLQDNLARQGIKVNANGVIDLKTSFRGSSFTPKERSIIKELYELAVEGGEKLTPSQIYNKDKLFSKLKRDARFEGVGDILIDTQDGTKSMFQFFRETYSNKLNDIDPLIKELNSQYGKFARMTDDIENSIIKSPNFNATKKANEAEFAKTNLRRILSDAQSQGAYSEIASQMDSLARELGYTGSNPTDLIAFAEELKRLYPETIPKTGFAGGVRLGVGDAVEAISKFGAPNMADQQKALRTLLQLTNG